MADPINPEMVETAKIGFAALSGAFIYHAVRPADTIRKAVTNGTASVLCGLVFTGPVIHWFELDPSYAGGVGALLGLGGLGIASGLLKALERVNWSNFIKGTEKQ